MRRNCASFLKFSVILCVTVGITVYLLKTLEIITDLDKHLQRFHSIRSEYLRKGSFFDVPRNVKGERIDWHDYAYMEQEAKLQGLGEHGKPATLESGQDEMQDKLFKRNGFNALLSDKISVNRSVADIRHKE